MALPVVIVASGGYPMNRLTAHGGLPVTLAAQGLAVTEAPAGYGLPMTFVTEGGSVVLPVPPVITYVTWDTATVTAVTLSGGNLVATNTGTTSTDQGACVVNAAGKSSGKYYFEFVWTTVVGGGVNLGVGVGTTASTYPTMGNGGTTGIHVRRSGSVFSNGSNIFTWQVWGAGTLMRVAFDLDNKKFWFAASGNWNNNASADPATNIGGLAIPAGTMVPFVTFGGSGGAAGAKVTTNFGGSAFANAVPAGFTAGWPT